MEPDPYGKTRRPLHRFWFEWAATEDGDCSTPYACGVTAHDRDDALGLLAETIFEGHSIPPIALEIPDVDLSRLDLCFSPRPVMIPTARGVWYPSPRA